MSAQPDTSPETFREAPLPKLPQRLFGRAVYYGWYIVALALIASMMSSGIHGYGWGSFIKPMTAELGWSRTEFSLGQTLSTAVLGFAVLFTGGLVDRRGARLLIVIGAVISGFGYVLLGQVSELWQYYVARAGIQTLGQAFMGALVVNVMLSNWFVRQRARVIAIAAMGNSLTALLLPTLAGWLIEAVGWRATWTLMGVAIWVVVIPFAWFIVRRKPEDFGLQPDGGETSSGGSALAAQRAAADQTIWTRGEAMRTTTIWLLIASFGLASMGYTAMLLHLIPYLSDSGYSDVQAAAIYGMLGLAGLVSKPIWGYVADKVRPRFAAAAEFVVLGFGVGAILLAPSAAPMYAAVFLLGVGIGGVLTLQETVWADYFGRPTLGTVRSIGRPFTVFSSAGGPVLAGLAYDTTGSYDRAFALFIGTYVLATVLILLTPTPRKPPSPVTAVGLATT